MIRELQTDKKPQSATVLQAKFHQRNYANEHEPEAVPPIINEVLRSPGQPLDATTRGFFETRFGHDFRHIRVHTDAKAAMSAGMVGAQAYTVGRNVVFAEGRYSVRTAPSQWLLAHELAHCIQQSEAAGDRLRMLPSQNAAEQEAETAAVSIGAGSRISVRQYNVPIQVMCCPEGGHPERQETEESPGFLGTIGGGLMGEFEENPHFAMIGVDVGVSLIPILDQVSDIRDIIAHLYYLIFRRQYDRFMRWLGLVFTLIGLIPEVGSAIKGASKFIIRGVRMVIAHMADILRPLRRFFPEINDISKLGAYIARNWRRFVASGTSAWNHTINRVSSVLNAIPIFFSSHVRQVREGMARIHQIAPGKLRDAFAWVRRQWDNVIEQVQEQLGRRRGPLAGASDEEIEAAVEHIDVPRVTGGARPRIEGTRVPTRHVPRLDANDIPIRPSERLTDAIRRIQSIIGRQLSDYPEIQAAWSRAATRSLQGHTLSSHNARLLYERTRDLFWQEVRSDPAVTRRFTDAGFILPGSSRRAAQLGGAGPHIPPQEITISLDHMAEIAQGNNWTRALDPTNLKFEFSAPNSFREIAQMRHPELRP